MSASTSKQAERRAPDVRQRGGLSQAWEIQAGLSEPVAAAAPHNMVEREPVAGLLLAWAQVQCIARSDRSDASTITHIGGRDWKKQWRLPVEEAISLLAAGTYRFYIVHPVTGESLDLRVSRPKQGRPFLETTGGLRLDDPALGLGPCPDRRRERRPRSDAEERRQPS